MKEKTKIQKGFIQIPLLVGIIVAIVFVSVITSGIVLHKQGKLVSFIPNIIQVFQRIGFSPDQVSKSDEETITPETNVNEKIQEKITELEKKIQELEQETEDKQEEEKRQPPPESKDYSAWNIVQSSGKYVVKVICLDSFDNEAHGSGIIIGKNENGDASIILTNYHVIKDAYIDPRGYTDPENYSIYSCLVLYSPNPSIMYTRGYLATPVYSSTISFSDMEKYDFGFLEIKELESDPYGSVSSQDPLIIGDGEKPTFCEEDLFIVGKEVVILGYPMIGGQTLTATEGIISGFDGDYYLTTSAKIEQGNSGGGAFLKSEGCLVGMPTFARLGKIESMARLIDMFWLINNYISKVFPY